MKKYNNYTVEQFVSDEFFQQWVKTKDSAIHRFWEAWIEQNPDKSEEIIEAKEIVLSFCMPDYNNYNFAAETQLEKLMQKIETLEQTPRKIQFYKSPVFKYTVAASLFIAVLSVGLLIFATSKASYSTAFNETREITLPDGSVAVLNSNSSISFNRNWEESSREVWIEGEALFKVKKIKKVGNPRKFAVFSNDVVVEVLGTVFNLNSRRGLTRVVLKEGSVKITSKGSDKGVMMKPGELVEINGKGKLVKTSVKPELYTSWKNRELIFDQTSLREIARILEDDFGYSVTFEDSAIMNRKFTGSSKTSELDILLTKISKTNDLDIIKHDQTITINNP